MSAVPLARSGSGWASIVVATAESFADALITTFGMAIIVASVVVLTGYAGQLSLCQYALAGFGAWVAARVADSFDHRSSSPWWSVSSPACSSVCWSPCPPSAPGVSPSPSSRWRWRWSSTR